MNPKSCPSSLTALGHDLGIYLLHGTSIWFTHGDSGSHHRCEPAAVEQLYGNATQLRTELQNAGYQVGVTVSEGALGDTETTQISKHLFVL